MPKYNYVARSSDGTRKTGTIEAATPAEAREKLATAGDQPVLVVEAGGRGRVLTLPPFLRSHGLTGILLATLVLIVGAVSVKMLQRKTTGDAPPETSPTLEVTHSGEVPAGQATEAAADTTLESDFDNLPLDEPPTRPRRPERGGRSQFRGNQPDAEVRYSPGGRRIDRVIRAPENLQKDETMDLRSGVDRMVNLIANTTPGMPPPPAPNLLLPGEDILKSLEADVVLLASDDDSIDRAANIAYAKRMIREYIDEGGDLDTFLDAYRSGLEEAFRHRQGLNRELFNIYRNEGFEQAQIYMEEKNAELEEAGIMPLKMPNFPRRQN